MCVQLTELLHVTQNKPCYKIYESLVNIVTLVDTNDKSQAKLDQLIKVPVIIILYAVFCRTEEV